MSVTTFQGTVENGQVRLAANVTLPDKATVFVVVPEMVQNRRPAIFNLTEMAARMPADYQPKEENFGKPVGREEW